MKTHIYKLTGIVFSLLAVSCSTGKYYSLNKVKADKKEQAISQYKLCETTPQKIAQQISENSTPVSIQNTNAEESTTLSTAEALPNNIIVSNETAETTRHTENNMSNPVVLIQNNSIADNDTKTESETHKRNGITESSDDGGTDGFSITSLIAGIVGFFLFGIILGTLAIIFGAIGISRSSDGKKSGKGLAIAGLVLGIIDLVGVLIVLSTM